MRTITDHKVNGLNEAIEISVIDEPGAGGANHNYNLLMHAPGRPTFHLGNIVFQNGPIATPADMNGLTNEALLAVLIDRMRGFQGLIPSQPEPFAPGIRPRAPFACRENAIALTHLETALMWLQARTRARIQRGVEGTHTP